MATFKTRAGKTAALIAAEIQRSPSKRWYYMSFASPTEFLGGAVVGAHGLHTATRRATELGINPGGEVLAQSIPRKELYRVPPKLRNRLLTEAEVRKLGGEDLRGSEKDSH